MADETGDGFLEPLTLTGPYPSGALVVQPGVEVGHSDVVHFEPEKAADLTACLANFPGLVFEAHSTDYQREEGLPALVRNGFASLKVGPWLTYAPCGLDCGFGALRDGWPQPRRDIRPNTSRPSMWK